MGLFVTDQGSIGRAGACDAVFPAIFPKDLIATEKSEINPRSARDFYVGALRAGPIFVMTDRQEYLVGCDRG